MVAMLKLRVLEKLTKVHQKWSLQLILIRLNTGKLTRSIHSGD